jgi:transcriptional regulator with XRE-family HTH domain
MTPGQLRAARALVGIKVEDLAKRAEVAPNTISRFEREEGMMRRATISVLARVLSEQGAELTADGGVRPTRHAQTQQAA